jgi:hypothetical protein
LGDPGIRFFAGEDSASLAPSTQNVGAHIIAIGPRQNAVVEERLREETGCRRPARTPVLERFECRFDA